MDIPIQVMALTSTQGDLTPTWFKYEQEDSTIETVKVDHIKSRRTYGEYRLIFDCWVVSSDIRRLVELHYLIREHKWTLSKILS